MQPRQGGTLQWGMQRCSKDNAGFPLPCSSPGAHCLPSSPAVHTTPILPHPRPTPESSKPAGVGKKINHAVEKGRYKSMSCLQLTHSSHEFERVTKAFSCSLVWWWVFKLPPVIFHLLVIMLLCHLLSLDLTLGLPFKQQNRAEMMGRCFREQVTRDSGFFLS